MLVNPQSLVSIIFGAKYFPNGRVTEASLGSNPSYIWRSIHGTLHLVMVEARWCTGSGRNVGIWNELWLPDARDPTIQTLLVYGLESTKVSSL